MSDLVWTAAFALLAIAAGASFVAQAAVNAGLRASLGSAFWAAFVSYAGGTLVMMAVLLSSRTPWPRAGSIMNSGWLLWTGGAFGVVYVIVLILLLPRLGTATVLALFVAGQMLASLAFDHFGLLGIPRHPVDLSRLLGAALLIGGVVLVRW